MKTHVISLLGLLIIFIPLNVCSRNFGYMNMYQLSFFDDNQQKPTLATISKNGYFGKDMEQQID